MYLRIPSLLCALALLAGLTSCGSVKLSELTMFERVQADTTLLDSLPMLLIQTDDILSIQVASSKPENVIAFQQIKEARAGSGESALGVQDGYRVDEEGNIYLPYIGQLKAAGKTLLELRHEISDSLIQYIANASVQVRFLNFRITLLGEVNRPNTYIIPNERLTILEAIGMAGDFTDYASRNTVLIIRARNDKREYVRINTQDQALFSSPYFYLQPNDFVYVEPLKAKQYATTGDFFQRYSGVIVPIVSLVTFFLGTAIR